MTHSVSHNLILHLNGNDLSIITVKKDGMVDNLQFYPSINLQNLSNVLTELPEIYSDITLLVSKKDFIKFLTDNSTWKKLKELSEFKIEDFKDNVIQTKKLRLDYEVYKLLGADAALLTDKQKVDILLINFYYKLVTEDLDVFADILKNDNFEWGFEFPENKERALDVHFKRISRFKNEPLKYFDYMEKYINTVSTKLLRKISKLYDLLPNEQKTTE